MPRKIIINKHGRYIRANKWRGGRNWEDQWLHIARIERRLPLISEACESYRDGLISQDRRVTSLEKSRDDYELSDKQNAVLNRIGNKME